MLLPGCAPLPGSAPFCGLGRPARQAAAPGWQPFVERVIDRSAAMQALLARAAHAPASARQRRFPGPSPRRRRRPGIRVTPGRSGRGVLARRPASLAWASAARSARQSCPTARSGYSASPASVVAWSRWAISSAPRPGLRGRRGRRPGRLTSRHSQTDPVGDRAPSESVACGPGPRSCRASCRAERRGP